MAEESQFLRVGVDIGSTTIKTIILKGDGTVIFKSYERHLSETVKSLKRNLGYIREHAGALTERVEALYDFVPSQLQEHEKKVVLSELEPEARMRDYQDPIFWLKNAKVVNVAYNATEPNVGLRMRSATLATPGSSSAMLSTRTN